MPNSAPLRVVIADDNRSMQALLQTMLHAHGAQVVGAVADGSQAVAAVERSNPDVLILDYQMPGKTGLEVLFDMHQQHPDVPVVFITASDDINVLDLATEGGASGFIHKPFTPAQILEQLEIIRLTRDLLRRSQPIELRSDGQHLRAVIADDVPSMRRLLRAVLSDMGVYLAGEAENGQQAVDIVLETKPDFVLLDIEMPVLNGLDALQQIHRELPRLPVIMVTSRRDPGVVKRAAELGAAGYLLKPYQPARIMEMLRRRFPQLAQARAR